MATPIKQVFTPLAVPGTYSASWFTNVIQVIARAIPNQSTRTVVANTTVKGSDHDGMIVCDCTAGALTVTLPTVSQAQNLRVTIVKKDVSANAVTISGTVSGVSNPTLTAQYNAITLMGDGTVYFKIASV